MKNVKNVNSVFDCFDGFRVSIGSVGCIGSSEPDGCIPVFKEASSTRAHLKRINSLVFHWGEQSPGPHQLPHQRSASPFAEQGIDELSSRPSSGGFH